MQTVDKILARAKLQPCSFWFCLYVRAPTDSIYPVNMLKKVFCMKDMDAHKSWLRIEMSVFCPS